MFLSSPDLMAIVITDKRREVVDLTEMVNLIESKK